MVRVRYFAGSRERAGVAAEELPLGGLTVRAARDALTLRHPALAAVLPRSRVAVDQAFASDDDVIPDGAELAVIPPVAGGAACASLHDTPLSADAAIAAVRHARAGAICVFLGTVRNHTAHEEKRVSVTALEYEAYAPMALKVLEGIAAEAMALGEDVRVDIAHRTGQLAVGDIAVVVAASAPHRDLAFAACRHLIERLKADAPIWKREHGSDGVVWVGMGP